MKLIKINKIKGFTLLEILIAIFIVSLISAMVWPSIGHMSDSRRIAETEKIMDEIEKAILGPKNNYDENGKRVIKGFVGDMKRWPWLWEPRPEIKPSFSGTGWEDPENMSTGLGQFCGYENGEPKYYVDPSKVILRPDGEFKQKFFKWKRPFRKIYDDLSNNDHIGGLKTENEGQPRGLWTKFVEDYPYSAGPNGFSEHKGYILSDDWKGPYINPPKNFNKDSSTHYAKNDFEYENLEPKWHYSGIHANSETWEDGCYNPATGELGEVFDDKEKFRLLQASERLTDAWKRALRFFITNDPDNENGTIFWIVSEGPDFEGVYPNKGICSSHSWTIDETDTMENNYDPELPENQDNIVRKLRSSVFEKIFKEETDEKISKTKEILEKIKKSITGDSPFGSNTGFYSDMLRFPYLYNESGEYKTTSDELFKKGYPKGLFNKSNKVGKVPFEKNEHSFGTGWKHSYLNLSSIYMDNDYIYDDFGNKIILFNDTTEKILLILSPGPDQIYDFYNEDLPETEIDINSYDPSLEVNQDNIILKISENDFLPGFLKIEKITILNASSTVKAGIYGIIGESSEPFISDLSLTDGDSDGLVDDMESSSPAFNFSDVSLKRLSSGGRYLVLFNDENSNNIPDNSESGKVYIFNVKSKSQYLISREINIDFSEFNEVFN
jgi:prepilin-type N-terminal cleavage/methylation domain-containing protein